MTIQQDFARESALLPENDTGDSAMQEIIQCSTAATSYGEQNISSLPTARASTRTYLCAMQKQYSYNNNQIRIDVTKEIKTVKRKVVVYSVI